ncbi:hypothetical protein HPB48_004822 [Haemaphysalis longicornis]|uniref:Uncharacterized protein n=1 Tax=Haemaphysalis longicornis TaxID=44386 RepID=A0A9J6GQ94_HAELO|nr:hypothetical protein HPB48_004822 [Haemaphysalis longicornis]
MTQKHKAEREIQDLYNPVDIEAILQRKAVLLVGTHSAKMTLKDICPHVRGRFYISREPVYVWNSIFVTNKNLSLDLFHEINKR